jgi:hypothetical protein
MISSIIIIALRQLCFVVRVGNLVFFSGLCRP